MFREGDYIVTLKVKNWNKDNCAKDNYCFKQRLDSNAIFPVLDLLGSKNNGHDVMSFNKQQRLLDWRYATPDEIEEYDRLGKPYDVTTLKTPQKGDYIKYIGETEIGSYYRFKNAIFEIVSWKRGNCWIKSNM